MSSAAATATPSRARAAVTTVGRFVFRFRDYLAPLGLLVILAGSRPLPLFGSEPLDAGLDLVGILVAAAGQALRMFVIGYAYIDRGGVNKRLAASRLVCEGIYAHVRNPMYVGNFLLLSGLALIYNAPLVYVVALPAYILAILAIIKSEEEFLVGKFGAEYEEYCRRVNRFVPHLRGMSATLRGMRFDWHRVIRKDYGTAFAWTSVAVVLIAWEQVSWHGLAASYGRLGRLFVAWLAIATCYGIARWLKKSGRLE